jgi:hypothetical protein
MTTLIGLPSLVKPVRTRHVLELTDAERERYGLTEAHLRLAVEGTGLASTGRDRHRERQGKARAQRELAKWRVVKSPTNGKCQSCGCRIKAGHSLCVRRAYPEGGPFCCKCADEMPLDKVAKTPNCLGGSGHLQNGPSRRVPLDKARAAL